MTSATTRLRTNIMTSSRCLSPRRPEMRLAGNHNFESVLGIDSITELRIKKRSDGSNRLRSHSNFVKMT